MHIINIMYVVPPLYIGYCLSVPQGSQLPEKLVTCGKFQCFKVDSCLGLCCYAVFWVNDVMNGQFISEDL